MKYKHVPSDEQAQELAQAAFNLVFARANPDFYSISGMTEQELMADMETKVRLWVSATNDETQGDCRDYPV